MTEHAQGLVLDQMEPIARGRVEPEDAITRVVGLLGGAPGSSDHELGERLPTVLADLPSDQATAIAADILRRASLPVEGGSREPRQIIERLLAKAGRPDPTDQVRRAFEFVAELHELAGAPERVERELRPVLDRRGLSTAPVDEVSGALTLLEAYGLPPGAQIEVDLSLARGLRYYTGLVFEIYADTDEGPLQVCGGGRYDDLVRALGGREAVPACGFMYGLERVDLAAGEVGPPTVPRLLVVGVSMADHPAAVTAARDVRAFAADRLVVEQDVRVRGLKASLRYADREEFAAVVIIGERERLDETVVLRDMRSRTERSVPRADLPAAIEELLR
jgi:histidyl-tRNA synthetase